jgi:hypothetical protein
MESWDGKFAGAWTREEAAAHFTSLTLLPRWANWCAYTKTVLETFLQQVHHMKRIVLFLCLNLGYIPGI